MTPSDSRVHSGAEAATRVEDRRGLPVLTWAALDGSGIDALVTTRHGGVSADPFASLNLALHVGDEDDAVRDNRRRALGALGADPGDVVVAEQVHGSAVAVVTAADRGRGAHSIVDAIGATDALVTTEPGLVLAILVADCAPVVLVDAGAAVLGCAHAGWRGTLGGVLEATVAAMVALGAQPARMIAGVGPVIAAARYEVGDEVATAARRRLGDAAPLAPARPGHWWFDLRLAVGAVLGEAGVPPDALHVADADTGPPGPFYSARAEGTCGRVALLARIGP